MINEGLKEPYVGDALREKELKAWTNIITTIKKLKIISFENLSWHLTTTSMESIFGPPILLVDIK